MTIPDWVRKYRQPRTAIEKQGNNYYLRRVTSVWNKKKKRAQKISGEYLGKITPDGIVPPKYERVRRSLMEGSITVREFGATQFILNCCNDIAELLKTYYPNQWREILVSSMFRLMYNSPLKNMEFYYSTSFISETVQDADLSDRKLGSFLRTLGMDRNSEDKFLHNFVVGNEYIAVDLTHVFSLSENVISSTLGHNSKNEYLPQINLFYMFSLDKMMPSYFRIIVGSINSVKFLIQSIRESGARNVAIVGDKGFYSADNVMELEKEGLRYILPLKRDSTMIDYSRIKEGKKERVSDLPHLLLDTF
ncbi:MAG: transposase [Thermoplasmata archaeon]